MHQNKIINLIKLDPKKRFDYFISTVVNFEKIWVLENDQGYLMITVDNETIFPVWPHKEIAESCKFKELNLKNIKPTSISYNDFIDQCIPDLIEEDIIFGVFFNENKVGYVIEPEKLHTILEDEYDDFWGE